MQRIEFEDTTITRQPYVTIDNVDYEVQEGTYSGGTDLDADTFNTLQDNIEDALANVGGNEIAISETEPTTETTKLWINSGEVGSQASEITNSYSTSTGIGYSANYVNNLKNYQDYTNDLTTIGVTGNISCESQFGICCFTMGLRSSSGDIAAYTKIVDGVPKPKYALNFNAVNGFGEAIRMQIGTDGAVYVANVMSSSNNYLGTISYVIDEENN